MKNKELSPELKKQLLEFFPGIADTSTANLLSLLRKEMDDAPFVNLYILMGCDDINLPRFKKVGELWEKIQREWSLPTMGQLAVGMVSKGEKVAWIDPRLFNGKSFIEKQKENIFYNGPGPFTVVGFGDNHNVFIINQKGERVGISPFWLGKKA